VTPGKRPAIVKPVRSENELDRALQEFCRLADDPSKSARLSDLADSIEEYEAEHHAIPEPSHSALLRHLMLAKECGPATLAKQTGISVREVRAILDGVRDIDPQEAGVLGRFFAVDASVFEPEPDEFQPTLRKGRLRRQYGYARLIFSSTDMAVSRKGTPRRKCPTVRNVVLKPIPSSAVATQFVEL